MEVIDITVSTMCGVGEAVEVSDEPSLSEHMYVRFDIEIPCCLT